YDVSRSFTANNEVDDATDAAIVASRVANGILLTDVVSLTGGTATFDDKNVGTAKTVTLAGAALSGADAGNYNLTGVGTATADITKYDVSGSFIANNNVYDDHDAVFVSSHVSNDILII